VKTIALVAKPHKVEAIALAKALPSRYPDRVFLAEPPLAKALGWELVEESELVKRADLLLVLGGDGSLIHGARLLAGRPVPILGINLGSLGFMTELPSSEMYPVFESVLAGRFQTSSRMKLSCKLYRNGRMILEDQALNEVVVNTGALARLADHELLMGGQYVTTFKADGVIIATPTGSTAYSLSAGGPIVHPKVDAMIVSPICPHALTQRPIVTPGDQTLSLSVSNQVPDFYLTIDGQAGQPLQRGDRLDVERSPNRVLIISNPKLDYFAILRQKLRWGER